MRDPRVDSFIADAQPFARPIMEHLRALVHATAPEAVETIKWGMPHFMLGNKNLCGIGSFKAHCAFIVEDAGDRGGEGMGHFGKIRTMADLPPDDVLRELLLARADRIRSGEKRPAARIPKAELPVPEDFAAALSPKASVFFDTLTAAQRRDYLEWVTGAKRAETRTQRIAQSAEWLAEGKKRYWKYQDC